MTSLYIFNTHEQAINIDKDYDLFTFNFGPIKYSEKFYVQLEDNNIKIFDKYMNIMYSGSLNLDYSRFNPKNNLKLVYDLDGNLKFIGGQFILEKDNGTLIHNGSGIRQMAAFRGSIHKVTRAYQ